MLSKSLKLTWSSVRWVLSDLSSMNLRQHFLQLSWFLVLISSCFCRCCMNDTALV